MRYLHYFILLISLFTQCAYGENATDAGVFNIVTQSHNVDENVGSVTFVVERSGGTQGAVSVDWTTLHQTADNQIDYMGNNAIFSWADGERGQKQVTIPIVDDTVQEDSEYFDFRIENPQGGAMLGNNTRISITINANDVPSVVDNWPLDGHVHQPISRATFVPFQRISTPTRLGVQAWSKNGIDRVEFTIAGGGYHGANPLVSTSRAYNPDNAVNDEFFVTIDPADFSSDGVITITPVAYGRDGGTRDVGSHTMIMNQSGVLERHQAWVEKATNGGNDVTAVVDDPNRPFSTIPAAIAAIYSAYGDRCDGGIVWVGEGNWVADTTVNNTTTNEWLTIARNPAALRENVVFNTPNALRNSVNTPRLHLKGISIGRTSTAINGYTLPEFVAANRVWLDNCLVMGNGVKYKGGKFSDGHLYIDPIHMGFGSKYSTGSEYTHSYNALIGVILSVNDYIHDICADAYQLGYCVIQPRVDNLDESTWVKLDETDRLHKYPHSDLFQMHVEGRQKDPENIILYGFNATNIKYQGFFWRVSSLEEQVTHAEDIAVINNRLSLTSDAQFSQFEGIYKHLLMWNNTFAGPKRMSFYRDKAKGKDAEPRFDVTDSSLVGNYFHALEVSSGGTSGYIGIFDAGNKKNNEAISNHYYLSNKDGYGDINNTGSPDTGGGTATIGTQEVTASGQPLSGSSLLIDRILFNRTSADVHGNARDEKSDVGAWEYIR